MEGRREISEALRLVEIVDVPENVPARKHKKAVVIRNKGRDFPGKAAGSTTGYRMKAYIMPEDCSED